MAVQFSDIDAGAFRRGRAAAQLRPYDALTTADRPSLAAAVDIIESGWRFRGRPPLDLVGPPPWDDTGDRAWAFALHAWEGLGPLLAAHDATGDARCRDFALRVALDWIERHPDPAAPSEFAWYDMAVGLRAYRLAYLLDVAARDEGVPAAAVGALLTSLHHHREELADDERFAAHSNHGFFQAAGALALARRFAGEPGMDEAGRLAAARLRALLDDQYTSEDVHREHSPWYHQYVTATLGRIVRAGLVGDEAFADRFAGAQHALAAFAAPDGTLAALGDTDRDTPVEAPEPLTSDVLRFVLGGGREGAPPEPLTVFPQSGYAVLRDAAGPSYLIQTAAFHSRTHKHADDLAFVWFDRGVELLSDPGRFSYTQRSEAGSDLRAGGFWYSDPRRVYVEATRSHNTVEIDGASHERRGVRPYGSALKRWGRADDLLWVESQVRHRRSIVHSRLLVLCPGRWLVVLDALADSKREPHDYVQRFHFAPELEAAPSSGGLALRAPGRDWFLFMKPLLPSERVAPARGREAPELLGWVSRTEGSLVPCWTSGYRAAAVPSHVFATLLALGEDPPIADHEASRSNVTGRRARLAWRCAGSDVRLDIDREGDDLAVELS